MHPYTISTNSLVMEAYHILLDPWEPQNHQYNRQNTIPCLRRQENPYLARNNIIKIKKHLVDVEKPSKNNPYLIHRKHLILLQVAEAAKILNKMKIAKSLIYHTTQA
jgi:hypothetical protein